jgi:serine protease Do
MPRSLLLSLAMFAAGLAGITVISPRVLVGQQPAPVTKEGSAAFRTVVRKTLPAVVSISPKRTAGEDRAELDRRNRARRFFRNEMAPEEMRRFLEEMQQGSDEEAGGFGSGVIVDPAGVIVTNSHVVGGSKQVEVRLQDDRVFLSQEIFRDPKTDVAVVKLNPAEAKNLPFAQFSDSDQAEVGDWILAMGAPFELRGTVTAGIISAKQRPLGVTMYEDFLQTDAAINPGNSGGPIVDLDGRIVGINTAIRSRTGTFAGVAFAIPSNLVSRVMSDLVKYGKVKRGYLGIQMGELTPEARGRLGLDSGIIITSLTEGSTPASKAGLQPRDIIVEADGKGLSSVDSLKKYVSDKLGAIVKLKVLRDGASKTVPVTIEEQPEEFGLARAGRPRAEMREQLEFGPAGFSVAATQGGVIVVDVKDESAAAKAGLEPGMQLVEVGGRAVRNLRQVEAAARASMNGLTLKVRGADGQPKTIEIN